MVTHKLATGPLVISVASAEMVEGNFGTQVAFSGIDCINGGDVRVYVNEGSAVRQLERLGLTLETVCNEAIHIEQVKKDGKTFTNFRKATQTEIYGQAEPPRVTVQSAPAATSASYAAPVASPRADVLETYVESLKNAVEAAEHLSEAGYTVSADNVVAIAATIFIQRSRR
jgi:hypothetical protein